MRFLLFLLTSLSLFSFGLTQTTFQRTYGGSSGDHFFDVIKIPGGYIACGKTLNYGVGGWDAFFLKLDQNGDTVTAQTYGNIGGSGEDESYAMARATDGGYYLAGYTTAMGEWAGDALLIRTDSNGVKIWDRVIGTSSITERLFDAKATADGGCIVVGETESYGQGDRDAWILKIDSTGAVTWSKTIGGLYVDSFRGVELTSDGGYIACGYTEKFGGSAAFFDGYVVKFTSNGTVSWTKTFGMGSYEVMYKVRQTADGGYIVAGNSHNVGAGNFECYLVKFDSTGTLTWDQVYGGSADDRFYDVIQTPDGGYLACGWTSSFGAGSTDGIVIKTTSTGTVSWARTYGGTGSDYPIGVLEADDGGYVFGGQTTSFGGGNWDGYLIKTDSAGNSNCNDTTATVTASNVTASIGTGGTTSTGGAIGTGAAAVTHPAFGLDTNCFASGSGGCTVSASMSLNPGDTICQSDTLYYTSTSSGATSQTWKINGFNVGTGTSGFLPPGSMPGFQLRLVAENGSCKDSVQTDVVINSLPMPSVLPLSGLQFCQPDSTTLTTQTYSSYYWSPTNETTQTVVAKTTAVYAVTVTDSNGCSGTSPSVNVFAYSPPNVTLTPLGPTTFCQGDSVIFHTDPGHLQYQWDPPISGADTGVAKTQANYYVVVEDTNGCWDTSNFVMVNVNPLPSPTVVLSDSSNQCVGDTVIASTQQFSSISWSPSGDTTLTLTLTQTTTLTITATDSNGCVGTGPPTSVTFFAHPVPAFTANDTGLTVTFTDNTPPTITSWSWQFGDGDTSTQQGPTHTYTAPGTYLVCLTTTNAAGCTDSVCDSVNVGHVAIHASSHRAYMLYPNPNQGEFIIKGKNIRSYSIYDPSGRMLFEIETGHGARNILVKDLPQGLFFVRINGGEETIPVIVRR